MGSNPLFIIPDFFFHFPNELCYGYLRFEGNGKNPLGRYGKKLPSWLSQFSFAKQGRPFSLPFQRNFPISLKPKVAIHCKDL